MASVSRPPSQPLSQLDPAQIELFVEDCGCQAPMNSAARQVLTQVVAHYNEPHRRYHDLRHVVAVVDRVTALATQPDVTLHAPSVGDLRLAAWFHDVIYDPTAADNEAQSAAFASASLDRLNISQLRTTSIASLIEMTSSHRPGSDAEAILADADLWTLGGPPDQYFDYGSLIRQEYSHVSEEQWQRGRGQFIQTFLTRPHIFHTPMGRRERETQARRNLELELAQLTV